MLFAGSITTNHPSTSYTLASEENIHLAGLHVCGSMSWFQNLRPVIFSSVFPAWQVAADYARACKVTAKLLVNDPRILLAED